ncbi:extracellular solute-binding protein [Aureibacillus halotolerans]|uniref:Carbohydrate ABC transporter substrate-binding protein (CUT1 family) n=1 Tax=Aureibacillus halotolerans TaxID=1508390 RepID=A0A4R6U8I2_9BACI|nr:extracellular solute-binding protein [Aureibacillus halotolerans]TDQ42042.1 carbohydrate ABC transporter substrate-binding protein (CUT1 family) [Aureibacillus halotolerans]
MKKLNMVFISFIILLAACQNTSEDASVGENNEDGTITLNVLNNWNGGTGPDDIVNNPVAQKIAEETGVVFNYEYLVGSEVEKITQIFATGSLPDIYTGPAWGNESEILLDAANQGELYDLTDYIEEYPNLQALVAEENMSPSLRDSIFARQEGGQYMLHTRYPAEKEDIGNWLYGLYVNKEIAASVGTDPQSIHTPEQLYEFLQSVKEQQLEINGNPIFPLGSLSGGWPLDIMSEMFVPVAGASSWMIDDDGEATLNFMTDEYEDYILYMRQLLAEGLLDPEAYTQTGAIGNEKLIQGRYATVPNQFNGLWSDLVKGGIEDKFVPLGPLNDFSGDPYRTEVNVTGSNLIAVPKTASKEKLDAAMRVINYLSSDEGYLLSNYGIEGVHYDMQDGKVVAKEEWVEKRKEDPDALKNEGIGVYENLSGLDRSVSLAGGPYGHQSDPKFEVEKEFASIMTPEGITAIEGKDPGIVVKEHQHFEQLDPVFATLGDVVLQAIHAPSEEDAKAIIETSREALRQAGIEDVAAEITNQAKAGTTFIRYRTSN